MQLGAILAGAKATVAAAITNFALPLGIAFQLADDLLGVYGNETELGKSVLSDLREGKRTLLIVKGLELADEAGRAIIERTLGNARANYSDLSAVRNVLDACGARTYIEALAAREVKTALDGLDAIGLNTQTGSEIERLAQFTIHRRT
jgi:geranylgeranyl diphosphate synthase type I